MTSTGQYSIVDRGGWLLIEPFTIKNYIDAALPIFECFFLDTLCVVVLTAIRFVYDPIAFYMGHMSLF